MGDGKFRIGIVAPASRIGPTLVERVTALAAQLYGSRVELVFHPQCFLKHGHFAGPDEARAGAFLDFANDPGFDAVWAARGGYGSNRLLPQVTAGLKAVAKKKVYLGYSDIGFLLAALDKTGHTVVHGPIPADMNRLGGESAVTRALRWLVERAPDTLEPHARGKVAAFNLTILCHLIGTPWMPDLSGRVLMVEEVAEHHYRVDRMLFHLTSVPELRKISGLRLGRVSDVPENDPAFEQTEEQIARHWCSVSGIPYLGRADIGHDADNKIVPFG